MTDVLQLVSRLDCRPTQAPVAGVILRPFGGPADVESWLEIRRKAFARQKVGIRDWGPGDFAAELLAKPWWRPEWMWFAESSEPAPAAPVAMGTATLGWRGAADSGVPVIHWLAVLPRYRRRGIGRLLVRHLEQIAWDNGHREVLLETHAAWTEAAALYQALGYRDA